MAMQVRSISGVYCLLGYSSGVNVEELVTIRFWLLELATTVAISIGEVTVIDLI